jgi:ABC-type dipeptide/oligopeptide/nickel transport system permease component
MEHLQSLQISESAWFQSIPLIPASRMAFNSSMHHMREAPRRPDHLLYEKALPRTVSPEQMKTCAWKMLGLNRPLSGSSLFYLRHQAKGDLGFFSVINRRPVPSRTAPGAEFLRPWCCYDRRESSFSVVLPGAG